MTNSVLFTKCGFWVHGRCAEIKWVTIRFATRFACPIFREIEGMVDSIEKMCGEVEAMNVFGYLGERLNASGGFEAVVTARVRICQMRFRK